LHINTIIYIVGSQNLLIIEQHAITILLIYCVLRNTITNVGKCENENRK